MSVRNWLWALAVAAFPLGSSGAPAAPTETRPAKETIALGTLHAPNVETARAKALAWLQSVGKGDEALRQRAEAIWKDDSQSVLDRVEATLALGSSDAARLLAEAASPAHAAPVEVPALLTDTTQSAFFRANLALAYGRELCKRRVYEEALAVFRTIAPEDVVEPAGYFFYRAVAEHALVLKKDANRSIVGLMEDVADAPDRYRLVALLMYQDMRSWHDKDLGEIARKMENIERRLALARGGPQTQKIQREVVSRLDEIIKRLENQSC